MGFGIAEQDTLGNDHRTTTANIEQIEHQPEEEQLALVGDRFVLFLASTPDAREKQGVGIQIAAVDRSGKGRIGQYELIAAWLQ